MTSVGKNIETFEPSSIAGVNVKWCSSFEKQFGTSSKC